GEAFAEDVAEVEHRALRQRLQREEPEELARARLDLGELAVARFDLEVARELREREVVRGSGPEERAFEAAGTAPQVSAVAELLEDRAQVLRLELGLERGDGTRAGAPPTARGAELRVVVGDVELVDAPLVRDRLRLELELSQPAAAEVELLGGDLGRRKVGPPGRRGFALRGRARREREALALRDEVPLPGSIPHPLPRHTRALELAAPLARGALEPRVHFLH